MNVHEILQRQRCGYCTMQNTFGEIEQAARCLLAGKDAYCPEVGMNLIRTRRGLRYRPPHDASPLVALSRRELEVLDQLAVGRGPQACAAALGVTQVTLSHHKTRILKKLALASTADLICLAVREGLGRR